MGRTYPEPLLERIEKSQIEAIRSRSVRDPFAIRSRSAIDRSIETRGDESEGWDSSVTIDRS